MSQTVGLIIPPPEIRTIIDKTAEFVVKHGAAVEENIIQAQVNNLSFNFLKQNDPYRSYYDSKIAEFARQFTQIISEQVEERTEGADQDQNNIAAPQYQNEFLANKDKLLKRQEVPKEQVNDLDMEVIQQIENPNYVIQIPTQLTSLELDIIKHTAQFVAKNGKKFLISLTEREKQNPQFDFLKPTNSLFSFFINLVNSYQKIIQIKESQLDNIIRNGKSKQHIYSQALRIFDHLKQKRQQEKKQSEIENEERLLKESIDWNDFYVAETIDFNDNFANYNNTNNAAQTQDIPAIPEIPAVQPTPIEEEKPKEPPKKDIPTVPGPSEIQPSIIPDENIKIKVDYKRQQNNQRNECTKCQICGQLIPIDDYNQHLEIEMLDPKYQQLKKEQQASSKTSSTVHDPQIIQNLYEMKKYRPEIFGYAEEQFEKIVENEPSGPSKPIWDGQSATMTRTTATVAMLAQSTRRKYEEQLKQKGLIPQSDEQNKQSQQDTIQLSRNKLSQLEEGVSLEPEQNFLQKNPGAVTLNIRIPEDIERNAKLTGQLIKLTFQPHNTIQQIKQAISEKIGVDLEQSNLKSTLFKSLKSEKSIAFYNLFNGAALELNLK
ncbi:hypothetical protein ABPG72_021978 [Tetrahymena utriculariae]